MGLESGRPRTAIWDCRDRLLGLCLGRLRHWERIAFRELALMPIGIDRLDFAGAVEFCDLIGGEVPAFGGEILAELLFVAGADDN